MKKIAPTYQKLCSDFKWDVPQFYNMGYDTSERWAKKSPNNNAIIEVFPDGKLKTTSYFQFDSLVNKGANYLAKMGLKRGDRVGILLPQSLECAISHIMAFKLGAISVPLFLLFGPDALSYRILNAGLPGYKFNFNDILSSIAIIQIKKIDKIIKYRKKLKDRYLKKLNFLITNKIIEIPSVNKNDVSALYNFLILFKKLNIRDKVANFLQEKKIYWFQLSH